MERRSSLLRIGPSRCQGGLRTPAFRVTTGRLAARLPGIVYRDGDSNPAFRVEGPVSWPLDHRGRAEAGRLERPKACWPLPVFGTGSSSGRITSRIGRHRAPGGVRTHGLILTKDALCSLSYKGNGSRRHDSNVRPPPSEGGALVLLSYGEAASTAGVEPALSGFVDRCLDPFGHVDTDTPNG